MSEESTQTNVLKRLKSFRAREEFLKSVSCRFVEAFRANYPNVFLKLVKCLYALAFKIIKIEFMVTNIQAVRKRVFRDRNVFGNFS